VRQSWNDPFGFAGLDKVAPPFRQPQEVERRIGELESEVTTVATEADRLSGELPGLELEVRSLAERGSTVALHVDRAAALAEGEADLARLRARQASITDTIGALRQEAADLAAGDRGDPQAHLQHPHRPDPPEEARYNVVIELWSAISVGLLLLFIAGLVFFHLVPWWAAFLIGMAGYVVIEAALRRHLTTLLLRVVLVLAVIAAVLLVYDFRLELVLAAVAGLALIVVADNVREVSRR
jgi:hypothetical protein